MEPSEPLRRGVMRSSLFVLLICALSSRAQMATELKEAEKRARALAGLEKLGATIVFDDVKEKNVTRIELRGPDVNDEAMEHVRIFLSVQTLYICNTRITDAGLARLEPLKDLQVL